MGLISCIECSDQVSDMAISCSHCGVPIKKSTSTPISHLKSITKSTIFIFKEFIGYFMFMKNIYSVFAIFSISLLVLYFLFVPINAFADTTANNNDEDKVLDFYKYIYEKARSEKPLSALDLKYQPRLEQIKKRMKEAQRSRLDYTSQKILMDKIRQEYSQVLSEKNQEYKSKIETKFFEIIQNLEDEDLLKSYENDEPNIHKIHQGLVILTCAEIISSLEPKTGAGYSDSYTTKEMSSSEYAVFGSDQAQHYLLISQNKDRSFEYVSRIIQYELVPSMPKYLFWNGFVNHRLLVKEYAKFKDDPQVLDALQKYGQSMCLPHAKDVRKRWG
jgi:hypothetical protein